MIDVDTLSSLYWNEHLSQREIAERIGVPQTTISRYLRRLNLSDPTRRRDQTGDANHNFKDGMSRSTLNRITKKLCTDAGIPLNICQVCNTAWSGNLDRHHLDRNRSNNTLSNIVVICPSCHAKTHDRERDRNHLGQYA